MPSLPESTAAAGSEFDSVPRDFSPCIPNQCSTPPSTSSEVYLRVVSRGTSYSRSRLAFHPYAQVIRVICTSTPVQSSTSLSEGFNLPTHRSTGFGYRTNDSSRAHDASRPKAASMLLSLWLPFYKVNLAIGQNSLARFSKRTI